MRKLTIGLMAVLSIVWGGTGQATDKAPVPQTGQILCWDSTGTEIFCRGTDQDGALQEGVEIPTPRYTDEGNGTLKDNLTGLIWLKNANCPNTARTWQEALDDVKNLNSTGKMNGNDCGDTSGKKGSHRTDWRLPNIRELFSLVDFAFFNPAISNAAGTGQGSTNDPFTNLVVTATTFYWSSTTDAFRPNAAWGVGFVIGFVFSGDKSGNEVLGGSRVLAVRGGS